MLDLCAAEGDLVRLIGQQRPVDSVSGGKD